MSGNDDAVELAKEIAILLETECEQDNAYPRTYPQHIGPNLRRANRIKAINAILTKHLPPRLTNAKMAEKLASNLRKDGHMVIQELTPGNFNHRQYVMSFVARNVLTAALDEIGGE